ncbi:hypothetical protein BKA62DRAFT_686884 [Auriculariales sp. MPI-PUGE-AT-0066]|nr:hypothetical protein BKA62DRAFT_686884 [Auriculariales sp. MPI-PUGE-AT-0066]
MNRDDECAPARQDASQPPGASVICLNFTCTYANATFNESCTLDTTTHRLTDPHDHSITTLTISRSSCVPGRFYCNSTTRLCVPTKELGEGCTEQADWECASGYCSDATARCTDPPETPHRITALQFALATVTIVLGMLSVCGILIFIHNRKREKKRAEVEEYYREQTAYRNALNALVAAVVTGDRESALLEDIDIDEHAYRDDSDQQPLLRHRRSDSSWKFGSGMRAE